MRTDAQRPAGGVYRPRNPRASPFYQCVRRHGPELDAAGLVHRPVEAEVLERFLACGDLHHGFARLEHLVRYYGYYSNRSRGTRRLAEQASDTAPSLVVDDTLADTARRANWARLIQKVYEVDPLECTRCGATLRIIALIDDGDVVKRILKHLNVWDPSPETITSAGPDPPVPKGETLPLTYHPVPDIA